MSPRTRTWTEIGGSTPPPIEAVLRGGELLTYRLGSSSKTKVRAVEAMTARVNRDSSMATMPGALSSARKKLTWYHCRSIISKLAAEDAHSQALAKLWSQILARSTFLSGVSFASSPQVKAIADALWGIVEARDSWTRFDLPIPGVSPHQQDQHHLLTSCAPRSSHNDDDDDDDNDNPGNHPPGIRVLYLPRRIA
jgi:hypothetical protein